MAEVVLEDFHEVVLFNQAVTTSGSSVVFQGYGAAQVVLHINVIGPVTGTTPTIQFTIQEIDPGDAITTTGVSATGAVITATGTQIVTLPITRSSFVKITWTVTGTTPSFGGTYATLINKVAGTSAPYDNLGNPLFGTAGSPSTSAITVQGASGAQPIPVSGTVTANQGAPNTIANKWPVQHTDGTNVQPTMDVAARKAFVAVTDGTNTQAVKAASTAAAVADPSAVVALSPNSSVPAGSNTIGAVNQGTAAALAGAWPTELTDGTHGPAAIKAASTAAVAADQALVVAVSPNNSVAVTQATAANLNAAVVGTKTNNNAAPGATNVGALIALANAAAPAWTEGDQVLASVNLSGDQRSISKITDGTNTAAVKAASTAAVAADPALVVAISPNNSFSITATDVTAFGALGALNATVSVTHPGLQTVGFQLAAGNLVGTILAEASFDGGTTWNQTFFDNPTTGAITSSLVFASSNTATALTIVGAGGAGMTRVRVSVFTSGTANATVRASDMHDPSVLYAGVAGTAVPPTTVQVGGTDGANLRAFLTDASGRQIVIGQGVAGTPAGGLVSVQGVAGGTNLPVSQATAANLNATVVQGAGSGAAATFWYVRVTDGTNTMPTMDVAARAAFQKITDGTNTAAVKAASTAAVATDPSLVTAFSPNSPLPTGANTIGAVVGTGAAGAPAGGVLSTLSPDTTASGALGALNAAVTVTHPGLHSIGMQLATGTLVGTLIPEVSFDGGTTWNQTFFDSPSTGLITSSMVFGSANTATAETLVGGGGAGMTRVRVSAYTSGTANVTVRASGVNDPSTLFASMAGSAVPPTVAQVGGTDGVDLRALATDTLGLAMTGDFAYAAAIARISGGLANHRFGFSAGGGSPQVLRATTYTEQASTALRSLSSSSATDTAAGTGAQQVTITGFDNSMNAVSEVVTLNGVTAVATVSSYRFIENLQVTRAGSGGKNVGTITLFVNNAGGGGVVWTIGVGSRATGGDNQTLSAHHYIRTGKTMYLLGMSTSMTGVTSGVTYGAFVNPLAVGPAELVKTPMLGTRQAMVSYPFRVPIALVGPGRFTLYNNATGGNEVDGSFEYAEF